MNYDYHIKIKYIPIYNYYYLNLSVRSEGLMQVIPVKVVKLLECCENAVLRDTSRPAAFKG